VDTNSRNKIDISSSISSNLHCNLVLSTVKQNVVEELVLWKCGCEASLNLKTLLPYLLSQFILNKRRALYYTKNLGMLVLLLKLFWSNAGNASFHFCHVRSKRRRSGKLFSLILEQQITALWFLVINKCVPLQAQFSANRFRVQECHKSLWWTSFLYHGIVCHVPSPQIITIRVEQQWQNFLSDYWDIHHTGIIHI
jgi:hypothetical protein